MQITEIILSGRIQKGQEGFTREKLEFKWISWQNNDVTNFDYYLHSKCIVTVR